MNLGFTVTLQSGTCRLSIARSAEKETSHLVSHARHGKFFGVLMGRLYYRADLCRSLSEKPVPAASAADLVIATYREHGTAGLERLEGDFALIIWDAST